MAFIIANTVPNRVNKTRWRYLLLTLSRVLSIFSNNTFSMVQLRDQWRSLLQILFRIGLTKPGDIIMFFFCAYRIENDVNFDEYLLYDHVFFFRVNLLYLTLRED